MIHVCKLDPVQISDFAGCHGDNNLLVVVGRTFNSIDQADKGQFSDEQVV